MPSLSPVIRLLLVSLVLACLIVDTVGRVVPQRPQRTHKISPVLNTHTPPSSITTYSSAISPVNVNVTSVLTWSECQAVNTLIATFPWWRNWTDQVLFTACTNSNEHKPGVKSYYNTLLVNYANGSIASTDITCSTVASMFLNPTTGQLLITCRAAPMGEPNAPLVISYALPDVTAAPPVTVVTAGQCGGGATMATQVAFDESTGDLYVVCHNENDSGNDPAPVDSIMHVPVNGPQSVLFQTDECNFITGLAMQSMLPEPPQLLVGCVTESIVSPPIPSVLVVQTATASNWTTFLTSDICAGTIQITVDSTNEFWWLVCSDEGSPASVLRYEFASGEGMTITTQEQCTAPFGVTLDPNSGAALVICIGNGTFLLVNPALPAPQMIRELIPVSSCALEGATFTDVSSDSSSNAQVYLGCWCINPAPAILIEMPSNNPSPEQQHQEESDKEKNRIALE